jgi:hypothetical protein
MSIKSWRKEGDFAWQFAKALLLSIVFLCIAMGSFVLIEWLAAKVRPVRRPAHESLATGEYMNVIGTKMQAAVTGEYMNVIGTRMQAVVTGEYMNVIGTRMQAVVTGECVNVMESNLLGVTGEDIASAYAGDMLSAWESNKWYEAVNYNNATNVLVREE